MHDTRGSIVDSKVACEWQERQARLELAEGPLSSSLLASQRWQKEATSTSFGEAANRRRDDQHGHTRRRRRAPSIIALLARTRWLLLCLPANKNNFENSQLG